MSASPTAPPVFVGTLGIFPLEDKRLIAYDLTDGTERWRVARSIVQQPATGEGLVFVADSDSLVALHQSDGQQAWQQEFPEALAAPLIWDNGWLVVTTASGSVLALRAKDGSIIWRRDLGSTAVARPALAADRVYIPIAERIIALKIEDGSVVWERRIGGVPNEVLALDDRVYVGSTDNYLYCLKSDAGALDWRWPTGGDVVGQPIADEQKVYFVSLDNVLRALDRRTGNQRWRRPLPLRPRAGPVRSGDLLVVSGVAPSLRMYAMKDGSPAGDTATDGELAAPPYVLPDADVETLIIVTRHLEKGTILTALARASEPAPTPPDVTQTPPPKG